MTGIKQDQNKIHSGFIALVGRPNVGKSTLMNTMIGEKVAIVSNKPQTTRNKLMGVLSGEDFQAVFIDTPGLHTPRTKLGEYMVNAVQDAMDGIDALMVLLDVTAIGPHDREIVKDMATKKVRKILVLNKIDLEEPQNLLKIIADFQSSGYDAIFPVSARTGDGIDELRKDLTSQLPLGPKYFPDDTLTDQPMQSLCSEIIREKALRNLRDEVPHGMGVELMAFKQVSASLTEIDATLYCEKESHKGIIIGRKGAMLQKIGSEARIDIENLIGSKVNLQLWVKVRPDWRNNLSDLRTLGYTEGK